MFHTHAAAALESADVIMPLCPSCLATRGFISLRIVQCLKHVVTPLAAAESASATKTAIAASAKAAAVPT